MDHENSKSSGVITTIIFGIVVEARVKIPFLYCFDQCHDLKMKQELKDSCHFEFAMHFPDKNLRCVVISHFLEVKKIHEHNYIKPRLIENSFIMSVDDNDIKLTEIFLDTFQNSEQYFQFMFDHIDKKQNPDMCNLAKSYI